MTDDDKLLTWVLLAYSLVCAGLGAVIALVVERVAE